MAFLHYIVSEEAENLGGALPPDPGGGEQYMQIDDDTIWQDDSIGSEDITYGSWIITAGNGIGDASLESIGTWYVGFRPTKIRVTFLDGTGDAGMVSAVSIILADTASFGLSDIGGDVWEITDPNAAPSDMDRFRVQVNNTGASATISVDKIEFYYDPANPPTGGGDWGTGGGEEGG